MWCVLQKSTHRVIGGKRNQRKLITFFLRKRIIKYEEKKVNSFLLAINIREKNYGKQMF